MREKNITMFMGLFPAWHPLNYCIYYCICVEWHEFETNQTIFFAFVLEYLLLKMVSLSFNFQMRFSTMYCMKKKKCITLNWWGKWDSKAKWHVPSYSKLVGSTLHVFLCHKSFWAVFYLFIYISDLWLLLKLILYRLVWPINCTKLFFDAWNLKLWYQIKSKSAKKKCCLMLCVLQTVITNVIISKSP